MCTNEWLLIGKISAAFGIKGWIKILSHTHPKSRIKLYTPWYVCKSSIYESLKIRKIQMHSKNLIAQIDGTHNRNEAEKLLGLGIYIKKSQLPKLADNNYYWYELEGMRVYNVLHVELGVVDYLLSVSVHDVLVIKNKEKEYLVPFIKPYLKKVNVQKRIIIIDWEEDF